MRRLMCIHASFIDNSVQSVRVKVYTHDDGIIMMFSYNECLYVQDESITVFAQLLFDYDLCVQHHTYSLFLIHYNHTDKHVYISVG